MRIPMDDLNASAFVASGAASTLVAYLERQGQDREALLRHAGIDGAVLLPAQRLPREANQRLWQQALETTADEALGLHVGRYAERGSFGLVEYLVRTTSTLAEAIALLEAYARLAHDVVVIESQETADGIDLVHRTLDGSAQTPAAVDFVVALFTSVARQMLGPGFAPTALTLARPQPQDVGPWQRYLRCPLTFGAAETRFSLDRSTLDAPLPEHDPTLHRLLSDQAERELNVLPPRGRRIAEQVAAAIEESLLLDGASLPFVARRLGSSERTLRRRLASAGLSFRTLRDGVRRRRALELEGTARQSEIAAELGFDSLSAYRRAFARWTGMTPNAWRRRRASPDFDPVAESERFGGRQGTAWTDGLR